MTKMGRLDTLPTAESLQRAERYSPFRFRAFHSKDSRRCKSRRKDRSKASYNKVQTPRNLGRHTPLSFHLGAACTSASETGYGSLVFLLLQYHLDAGGDGGEEEYVSTHSRPHFSTQRCRQSERERRTAAESAVLLPATLYRITARAVQKGTTEETTKGTAEGMPKYFLKA